LVLLSIHKLTKTVKREKSVKSFAAPATVI